MTVAGHVGHAGHPPSAGTGGRQLVPGLLYIDDKGQKPAYKVVKTSLNKRSFSFKKQII